MKHADIFSFITTQENDYKTQEIRLGDNWSWNMRDHLQLIYHLRNSQFYTGDNNWMRPMKNIMEPIIELANWTEDIELKDVAFFIEGTEDRVLSFLIKKYHDEVYSRENNLEDFIDQITESDNTYGGVLLQDTKKGKPETPSLMNIAFCDQTDILGGPLGLKFFFSPDSLRKMSKKGWGQESNGATISLDDLIVLASEDKETVEDQMKNKTPGKVIEVYVVKGNLPEHYLLDNDEVDKWYGQVQVVAFYTGKDKKRQGVILYRKPEKETTLKFFTAAPVENRGLGRGVGEKMLQSQVWTNWLAIHKHKFYEAASKVPIVTDDESFTNKNQIQDMDNLEVATVAQGSMIRTLETASPANVQMLMGGINEWMEHAQFSGAAQDSLLGVAPVSGTTFKGQERTVAQGRGSHDRKRGKRAKFIEEVYRDWIIPQIVREITKGREFLATLSAEELTWVSEQLATNYANQTIKDVIINGGVVTPQQQQELMTLFKTDFAKRGNRKMLEILKKDFEGIEVRMGINVANKQKNLADLSDKILSLFQFAFSNPQGFQQAMQIPALAKSFNDIMEYSGLNQSDFLSLMQAPVQSPQTDIQQAQPTPLELNQQTNVTAG
jgi:hypothetical protein